MDALAGLLEERKRYENWLGQLDVHRSNAPSHVIDRVKTDYEERLRGVIEQLRSRAADLEASASSMRERTAALLSEETARRDERAEGELRAAVGEFSAEYARDLLARCDDAIGRLFGERSAITGELTRLEEILALVRRPATEPAAAPPPAPAPSPFAPPAPAAAAPSAAAPSLPTPDGASLQELAFLNSVVQPRSANVPLSQPGSEFAPPLPGMRRNVSAIPGESGARESAAPARVASASPGEVPAFLRDMPTEQAKTLKCQECGTMNYATEWYCERCGGELAAM
jgi:hypothetical protein